MHKSITASFYWHDYETFGANPKIDRASQFAGIRTDESLNIINDPLVIYNKITDDYLPEPIACLITSITPQKTLECGLIEKQFIDQIYEQMAQPNTCTVGYNNIRFDDEVTRNTLYRNFYDPYTREWQNGNSRWDIIDMARMTRALRPEGIIWPDHANGQPSFKLEDLTTANHISHTSAHDALSDVLATIEVAKLIKQKQPRLYNFLYQLRLKQNACKQLDIYSKKPLVHSSSKFPSINCGTSIIAPLCNHPTNKNHIICIDLRHDPAPLLNLDAETIKQRLYTKHDALPDPDQRIPIKSVHINKCPALAPLGTLDAAASERINLNIDTALQHHKTIVNHPEILQKITTIFSGEPAFDPEQDPDLAIYSGGFFSNADRKKMECVSLTPPNQLNTLSNSFCDERLPEMLLRYRARNFPETLAPHEKAHWFNFRHAKLTEGCSIHLTFSHYFNKIEDLRSNAEPRQIEILDQLEQYGQQLQAMINSLAS